MAPTLPLNIPIPQSAAIASFNYTDIAEATGIVKFFGSVWTSGGTDYPPAIITSGGFLTTAAISSGKIAVSGATITSSGEGFILNTTHDVVFNRPQNIKGNAYLNITLGAYNNTASGSEPSVWLSGATLTNATTGAILGSAVTSDYFSIPTTAVQARSKTFLLKFDLTDQVYHFKAGETLRLTLPLWGTGGSASAISYGGYGADPADRNDTGLTIEDTDTTKMELYVPFLLNTV